MEAAEAPRRPNCLPLSGELGSRAASWREPCTRPIIGLKPYGYVGTNRVNTSQGCARPWAGPGPCHPAVPVFEMGRGRSAFSKK